MNSSKIAVRPQSFFLRVPATDMLTISVCCLSRRSNAIRHEVEHRQTLTIIRGREHGQKSRKQVC